MINNKTFSFPLVAVAVLTIALLLLSNTQNALAASTLFGDAAMVSGGNPGDAVQIRSDGTISPNYGGISFNDAAGLTFPSLTTLSTDFNVTDDSCGAGSPRFQIQVDTNGDTVPDGNVFVYLGPSPSYSGCTTGWQNSGNLIGNSDAGRWDFTQFGGPLGTYASAPANVLAGTIRNISIVDDSSWSAVATGGDGEMTTLLDNVTINSTVYSFTAAPPVKVTIVKYVNGQHATALNASSTSFPMVSSWDATNLGGPGNGSYSLSTTGFNTPNAYEAVTSDMTSGSDYSTNEVTNTSVVGMDCSMGQSFRLVGYTTGDTLAAAQSGTPSTSTPTFTNFTTDKYVIVWNEACVPPTPPPPVNACATPTVAPAGYTLKNGSANNDKVTLAPNTMYVGKGGNDQVSGPNGNYIVCLGDGNDKVTLGNGDSIVDAGNGNNDVKTGNGTGNIKAGAGNDKIVTGNGTDTINAGGGNNNVSSGGGNDSVTALGGNDKVNGGAGASDSCDAGGGNNYVSNCEL